MTIEKFSFPGFPWIYAVGQVYIEGKLFFIAGSEERKGKVFLIDSETKEITSLWDEPGGTMSLVGINDSVVLSIDEFFPIFDSKTAKIVRNTITKTPSSFSYQREPLFTLPWCHRISLVHEKDADYLVCATLSKEKKNQDDWEEPGEIWVSKYEKNKECVPSLLYSGIFKNHAMWTHKNKLGFDDVYVGGENGLFKCSMSNNKWEILKLLSIPTGDIAIGDLDEDQEDEIAIIQGMHGDKVSVFKMINGSYNCVYTFSLEFGHVLWIGMFNNRVSLIVGARSGEKAIKLYQFNNQPNGSFSLEETIIDKGVGPAQISVAPDGMKFITTNHGNQEIGIYILNKDR